MMNCKTKSRCCILLALTAVVAAPFFYVGSSADADFSTSELTGGHVKIKGISISVMIADEPLEHWKGLSDREAIGAKEGMLFIFKEKQEHIFVMRRMHFPLDIIFIQDNKIVKIFHNLPPEGNNPLNSYSSFYPVNYVLEVNGGFAATHKIKEGDEVEFFFN